MNCDEILGQILIPYGDKIIIKYEDWKRVVGDNQFTNEKCDNDSGKPIHVQKADGTIVATKAVGSNAWIKQPNPNGISFDSDFEGGRKSRRHKRKTLKRKTKRRRYKHRRSRRTRR